MRKNAWILKAVSLALVMVLTIGFLPPIQILAADTENDVLNLGTPNVATSGITLSDASIELEVNQTHNLKYTLLPEGVEPFNVEWITSDAEIATVEDGIVTAIKEGTAEITVHGVENAGLTAVCVVDVIPSSAQIMAMAGSTGNFIAPIEEIADTTGWVAISDRAGLEAIKNNLSGNYFLTADIDLSGAEWVPIGDASNPFTGIFDGQGHLIRNLFINGTGYSYNGLLGCISKATIRNVALEDINMVIVAKIIDFTKSTRIVI